MDIYEGKLHVYVDEKTRKIVGAELVAPRGEHLAHLIGSLIQAEMTVDEALRLPYYHPTFEEALANALNDALEKL
jgi:dihydrolipoamide dehydrogenase